MTLPATPRPPHPYARRHLAAHATAGGKLNDDVLNLKTLPYLDEARLSALLRLTEPAPLSPQWLLLSAFRSIRHRWSWDNPDANAAALDVAQLAVDPGAPLPDRWTASGLTWKPRLVEWQSGGTIVASDQRGEGGGLWLTIGTVQEAPILVTGDEWSVRLWDPATGQPIGEPLYTLSSIRALALAEGPGLVLAACEGGQLIAWDAVTRLPPTTVGISDPEPTALAVGEIQDRWLMAAGGASGVVQVQWIDSGELVHEFRYNGRVRAVALAKSSSGRLHLAVGYSDGDHGWIAIHDAVSGEPRNAGIAVQGQINDAVLALVEDKLLVAAGTTILVAAGTTMGSAAVWDALSGAPVSRPIRHDGAVSSVALATIGGIHLLATGSSDRTARLWHALGSVSAGPPLPHPAPVNNLAFGKVEGRTMLATESLDGNTRLWDPLRASAARVTVEGWFPSVAMDADVVITGSEDGHVRLWDIASGTSYPPLQVKPGYSFGVKVWLGGTHPRILLAQHRDRVSIWDVSDPSQPAFRRQAEIGNRPSFDLNAAKGRPLLATLDDADEVMVSDLLAGTKLFRRRISGADSLSFIDAPDYPLLAVGAHGKLHLLNIESRKRVRAPLPMSPPRQAAVGRLDGVDVLAVLEADGLRLYDLRTGKLAIEPVKISSTPNRIAWGRVGDRDVVVTAHFATIRVWNPRTGRKITELPFGTHIGAMSLQQTDGGQLLVAVSGPGLVLTELREISL